MIFIKNIKMILIKIDPFPAQAGKPVPPDSLGVGCWNLGGGPSCKRLRYKLLFATTAKWIF
jgi:hypothetical protein